MEFSLLSLIILHLVSLVAGFFSAIAGGGGLVILPALMAAGLPPLNAMATTKIQGMFGLFGSAGSYHRRGILQLNRMKLGMLLAAISAFVGVMTVQSLDTAFLEKAIPFAMLLVCLYMVIRKPGDHAKVPAKLTDTQFDLTVGPISGFYIGVFGPGVGSFLIIAFNALRGDPLKYAVANSKGLLLAGNVIATATFAFSGFVYWELGLSMAITQLVGAWFGARMAVEKGSKIIQPVFIGVTLATTCYLLLKDLG